ncbi:hypothetical protein [Klebsiella pneumoniae]|uniref:hypothetical protein n=2 Tax=Klebsiella pneumoniae TaxID=573 RepID=UPI0034219660
MPLRITPSVAEQEGQQTETEATGAPQKHHYTLNQQVGSITSLPMEIITISDATDRVNAAEIQIRKVNSFKAFVDPSKLAEMLACYCDKPWDKIADAYNATKDEQDKKTAADLKDRLKNIWKRRNQIAHEADVNPAMAGISLWPITKEDTELTVGFIKELGDCLPMVISQPLDV